MERVTGVRWGGVTVLVASVLLAVAPAEAAKRKRDRARLAAVEDCRELLPYVREKALGEASWQVPVWQAYRPGPSSGPGTATAAPQSAVAGAGATSEEASDTNVQEPGVDEPDVVKTRGGIVYAVAGRALHVVDVRGGALRRLAEVALPQRAFEHELFVVDGRVLVLSEGYGTPAVREAAPSSAGASATTTLTEIDVRDPARPQVVRSLEAEGRYVSARRQGDVVRVVLSASPTPIVLPAPAEGERYAWEQPGEMERRRREAIGAAGPSTFLPDVVVRNGAGAVVERRLLHGCQRIRRPADFSGLDVLSVLTLDLGRGAMPVDLDGVLASGDEVYASDEGLYVATSRVHAGDDTPVTRIHRFAAGRGAETRYRSSGSVRGYVLNQFSFSEHRGVLRVATTEVAPPGVFRPATPGASGPSASIAPAPPPVQDTESFVTILDERDGALVPIGRVGGLGKGERIYAVRFVGDVGYVLTFRQVDPLYTLDLADPRAPRVRGELKILGYSAYLHPVGEDLLLGVGQDATEAGRRRGTQISLFDVADPARPRRLHQRAFSPTSSSQVEWDHRAFLWWPRTRTAVLPVTEYQQGGFRGAAAFRVSRADGLREVGRVQHPAAGWQGVRRSMVVGERLLTLSDRDLVASRLADLRPLGALELVPAPPSPSPGPGTPQPAVAP